MSDVSVLLGHHLKQLKLPTIGREYASIAASCSHENSDYATYLLRLTELELIERQRKAFEARIRQARFPIVKTIDTFDFKAQPSINEALIKELLNGEYLDKKENILLIGNPGTGKTHLSTALGYAACSQGKKTRFTTISSLITQMLEMREERTLQRYYRQLERMNLIVLDELGYVPVSKTGAEMLFDVVSRAYERTSLIITTNLPFEEWTEVLHSQRLTGALIDRLTHRIHIIEANGESYRLKSAKKKINKTKK